MSCVSHDALVAHRCGRRRLAGREAGARGPVRGLLVPVYALVRRNGADADQALDLTQAFFTRLLEEGDLADLDRGSGRFRSWLLSSVKHFIANDRDRECAPKRGGRSAIQIDAADAESRYCLEPSSDVTPDRIFERRWALTLLGQCSTRGARSVPTRVAGGSLTC